MQPKKQKQFIEPSYAIMPWQQIEDNQLKVVSRTIETSKQVIFSAKSLKHLLLFFSDVYDRHFYYVHDGTCGDCFQFLFTEAEATTALLRRGEPSEQSQVTILQKISGNSQESFTGKSSENVDSYFEKFLVTLSEEQDPRNFL